jgi:hypothetical protein
MIRGGDVMSAETRQAGAPAGTVATLAGRTVLRAEPARRTLPVATQEPGVARIEMTLGAAGTAALLGTSDVARARSAVRPGMTVVRGVASGVDPVMSGVGLGMTGGRPVASGVDPGMTGVDPVMSDAAHGMTDGAVLTVTAASRQSSGTASAAEPRGCPPSRAANPIPPSERA